MKLGYDFINFFFFVFGVIYYFRLKHANIMGLCDSLA